MGVTRFAPALVALLFLASGPITTQVAASRQVGVITLTDDSFEHDTQAASGGTTGPWFIKFYAPWCGHCKKLAPTWEALAEKLQGKVNVAEVDCTQHKATAKRFGIKSYPTLLLIKDGQMYKYSGARTEEALADFVAEGYGKLEASPVPVPQGAAQRVAAEVQAAVREMDPPSDLADL